MHKILKLKLKDIKESRIAPYLEHALVLAVQHLHRAHLGVVPAVALKMGPRELADSIGLQAHISVQYAWSLGRAQRVRGVLGLRNRKWSKNNVEVAKI